MSELVVEVQIRGLAATSGVGPQCDKPVRGGMGTVPFKHRFDYYV